MSRNAFLLLAVGLAAAGCGRRRVPVAPPRPSRSPRPQEPATRPSARPTRKPSKLDRRVSVDFDAVPFPTIISILARDHGIVLGVSRSIPLEAWTRHKVTLRLRDVEQRALLDWLVRPLGAQYAVEENGHVWVAHDDELLRTEPLEVRTYPVPTHIRARRPVRGSLSFAKEQRLVVDTLEQCLRYLLDRRPGCRLAFHGDQDVLVARLPARGHRRLVELLDAIRHGTDPPGGRAPTRLDLTTALGTAIQCGGKVQPLETFLVELAGKAKVNIGWDPGRVGEPVVTLARGERTLREALDVVVAQTRVARYAAEPGHGVWLFAEGDGEGVGDAGAAPWDRAEVRAYEILPLLRRSRPEAVLQRLRKRMDGERWESGLPAAAVFTPTARLIVVHDPAGQQRVAVVVQEMLEQALIGPPSQEEP